MEPRTIQVPVLCDKLQIGPFDGIHLQIYPISNGGSRYYCMPGEAD